MPINNAKRREMKRKSLRHVRLELEIARERGLGVNFTSYMEVEEYEPTVIEKELEHAKTELNVLTDMINKKFSEPTIIAQIDILHELIRPQAFLEQQKAIHNVNTIQELKGYLL